MGELPVFKVMIWRLCYLLRYALICFQVTLFRCKSNQILLLAKNLVTFYDFKLCIYSFIAIDLLSKYFVVASSYILALFIFSNNSNNSIESPILQANSSAFNSSSIGLFSRKKKIICPISWAIAANLSLVESCSCEHSSSLIMIPEIVSIASFVSFRT